MKFFSTRGKDVALSASEAITKGLADDGGLFVPETFPDFSKKLNSMLNMAYAERASEVIHSYLEEYDKQDLLTACESAYSSFEDGDAAPVVVLEDNLFVLELFHGPTLAFKDIALTLLPYLLRKGADYVGVKEKILILTATSGDTGKAALEGFKDKDGIYINVFYPSEGVSDMQKLQMSTQMGSNVNVVAVEGNFDDCQSAVKRIFSNNNFSSSLKDSGVVLSSANSINFGRLVPQIAYYFSAYLDLVNADKIKMGQPLDFCVPTGNFGNILAGLYAKRMGLPVGKLICASNSNNVLTEFFTNGSYNINREFFKTASPSMDILISSNLERLLFEISGRDGAFTKEKMEQLKADGVYSLSDNQIKELNAEFFAGYAEEEECFEQIFNAFDDYGYVLDTHTAVAFSVVSDYLASGGDNPIVVLSTASPYKFPQSVLKALTGKGIVDCFKASQKLYELSAEPIPQAIEKLREAEVRFKKVVKKNETEKAVLEFVQAFKG